MADFPSRPNSVTSSFDDAEFTRLRDENQRLTRLASHHRHKPVQHARVLAERQKVREKAARLIELDALPEESMPEEIAPPALTLTAELLLHLCETAAWVERNVGATQRQAGLTPPTASVSEVASPAEQFLAACGIIHRASDRLAAVRTETDDVLARAKEELAANERAGRQFAAKMASEEAALARRDLEMRERHAAFEAAARDLSPALSRQRVEMEKAQTHASWTLQELRELQTAFEQCQDKVIQRENSIARHQKTIELLREEVAAARKREDDLIKRAFDAQREILEFKRNHGFQSPRKATADLVWDESPAENPAKKHRAVKSFC